ncbi:MAG: AEC family transporter [Clostridia bacterium]|nr:AEC family transporter [Clostridia bacterium]
MNILSNIIDVSSQVLILFSLMMVGLVFGKLKIFTDDGIKQLTKLLFTVVTVCIIIHSFVSVEFSSKRLNEMLYMFLTCLIATTLGFVFTLPLYRKTTVARRSALKFASVFSNCGFMAIPLAQGLFGEEGVFLVSIFMCTFQILIWTLGIYIINQGKGGISVKKIFLNPGVIGIVIGIALFFLRIKLPYIIASPVGFMADLNTPLAMVITGYYLKNLKLKLDKEDIYVGICCLLRLAVIPLLTFGIMYLIGLRGTLLCCAVLPAAAPSASNTTLFSVMFGGDGDYASRVVSVTTLLSLFTIPLIMALVQSV